MLIQGGKNIWGVGMGVICLESMFPKLPGHIKNPITFDFPVAYKIVPGATIKRLIRERDQRLLEPFLQAARELQAEGMRAITGSCGFLALFQRQLADAVDIPVFASSLIQIPMISGMIGGNRSVGVLTASSDSLGGAHFEAVGAGAACVHVAGMDGQSEFREVILEGRRHDLDFSTLEKEIVDVAKAMVVEHPDIAALVLECTDMCSFAYQIQKATGRPVFDLTTLTKMVYESVCRRPYASFDGW